MAAPAVRVVDRLVDLADVPATPASASLRRTGDGAAWEAVVLAPQASLDAHAGASAAVHGIADTSKLVVTTDARLSDARVPIGHHASHSAGGSDPIAPADIGAPAGGTVNSVTGDILLRPQNYDSGIVVKSPGAGWTDTAGGYGTAQAFILFREDQVGDSTPNDNVLFRVNGYDGSLGMAGNIHLATGLNQRVHPASTQAMWIQPYDDMLGIVMRPASTVVQTQSYVLISAPDNTTRFEMTAAGKFRVPTSGNTAGVEVGGDVTLYRPSALQLSVDAQTINFGPSVANNTLVQLLSSDSAKYAIHQTGRTAAESQFGTVASSGLLFIGTVAGDTVLRGISGSLHMGVGSSTAQFKIGSSSATLATPTLNLTAPTINLGPSTAQSTNIQTLSGGATNWCAFQTGRTTPESQFITAAAVDQFFTGVVAGDTVVKSVAGALHLGVGTGAATVRVGNTTLGFHGTAPTAKGAVTGSRGGNAALASLLTQLANKGLITDSTTA